MGQKLDFNIEDAGIKIDGATLKQRKVHIIFISGCHYLTLRDTCITLFLAVVCEDCSHNSNRSCISKLSLLSRRQFNSHFFFMHKIKRLLVRFFNILNSFEAFSWTVKVTSQFILIF